MVSYDDAEDYRGSVAHDAYEVMRLLQGGVRDRDDPAPRTKAAFVYA